MRKLKYISVFILSVLSFSCSIDNEELNQTKSTNVTEAQIFADINYTRAYLYDIYSRLSANSLFFPFSGNAFLESVTSDCEPGQQTSNSNDVNAGAWNASLTRFPNYWYIYYSAIRSSNRYLARVDSSPLTEKEKISTKAEARFLRAFFHLELMRNFGRIPIVTELVTDAADPEQINVPQSDIPQVESFIASELDLAAKDLPVTYLDGENNQFYGRATKGAALALKARLYLYTASPLYDNLNPGIERWQKAARAAKAVIDMNEYALFTYTAGDSRYTSYERLFNTRVNSEQIFSVLRSNTNDVQTANLPGLGAWRTGKYANQPTQEFVDSYEMSTTHKLIDEPGSGYDPQNPYVNRDPRLYTTIFHQGGKWKDFSRGGAIINFDLTDPIFAFYIKTGYLCRKYMDSNVDIGQFVTTQINFPIIRYADILLMYAEAVNELQGPDTHFEEGMTACQAMNMVRRRAYSRSSADISNLASSFPEDLPEGMSKDQFKKRLINERRVELSFEQQRWYDVRRWGISSTTEAARLHGMRVSKVGNTLNYEKFELRERVFYNYSVFHPIYVREVLSNKNLVQNPGW